MCKRKNLKTAAVRQNRCIPIHEFVQTAELAYKLITRTNMQVICVGKLHLAADSAQIIRSRSAANCSRSADVHENGSFNFAVNRVHPAPSRIAAGRYQFKFSVLHFSVLHSSVLHQSRSLSVYL